jgi:hypothetical protein
LFDTGIRDLVNADVSTTVVGQSSHAKHLLRLLLVALTSWAKRRTAA